MKPKTTGTLSGCVGWIIVFGVLSTCIFPSAMMIGGILKKDPVLYVFTWMGVIMVIGLVIAALLALALATPASILISIFLHRRQQPDITAMIELS